MNDKMPVSERSGEQEIRADEVKPGDYLLGLGRVQSITQGGGTKLVTLASEWDLWRVRVLSNHRVVVLRGEGRHAG